MRARYFLGFAAALGLAGSAAAQTPYSRPQYPTPQMPPRGTTGLPPNARPAAAATPSFLPPPTVTLVSHQEPAPTPRAGGTPPAKLPDVAPTIPSKVAAPPAAAHAPPVSSYGTPLPSLTGNGACSPSCDIPCTTAACPPPDPVCPCGPVPAAWVRAEWLFWATSGQHLPPLAATAPLGTARDIAGRLSTPSTTVLYGGDDRANDNFRSGLRVTGGFWLDECGTLGVSGDFFFLGRSRDRNGAGSDATGSPILTRPFFNALTGEQFAELVSFPGVLAGATTFESRSSLIGGGVNLVKNLCCDPCGRVDLLAGYRYFNLTDEVTITEDLTALDGQQRVPPGTRFQIRDHFRTENHFHGGVLGLAGERKIGFCFVGGQASIAFGNVRQITEISGFTTTTANGAAATRAGGLFTQTSNIGRYEQDRFAVMPEVGVRAGVQVTEHLKAYVGYNYLYLSSAARAGEQIDVRVNPNLLPPGTGGGPNLPAYLGRTSGFWAQGVSIGAQFEF